MHECQDLVGLLLGQAFEQDRPPRAAALVDLGECNLVSFEVVVEDFRGAQIGAGAVVAEDVPDYAVAAGVPARVLRSR